MQAFTSEADLLLSDRTRGGLGKDVLLGVSDAEPGLGMHGILDPMVIGSEGGSGVAYWIAPDIVVSLPMRKTDIACSTARPDHYQRKIGRLEGVGCDNSI